jgi:uncharacterized membrane protein
MPAKKKKKAPARNKDVEDGKLQAVLSYLLITAPIVLFTERKNKFAEFHAKQGTALLILFLVARAVLGFIPIVFVLNFWVTVAFVLISAYMAVMAAQGKKQKLGFVYSIGDWLAKEFKK